MGKVIKADIAARLRQITLQGGRLDQKTSIHVVGLLTHCMRTALEQGWRIEIRGLGVFEPRRRRHGYGRNVRTGVKCPIPAGARIRFKPGNRLQNLSVGNAGNSSAK